MDDKRDDLLAAAINRKMSYQETQDLLRKYGKAGLYARDRRDSIIIWAIYHEKELADINQLCRSYHCRELKVQTITDKGRNLDESYEEENESGSR